MNKNRNAFAIVALAATLLAACGSRRPANDEPPLPEPTASASNAVIVPAIAYGKTAEGLQLSKADDSCDVPASLRQAIQDQLLEPYEFVVPSQSANVVGAPTLRIEITDILANGGGMYGGPKIVQLRGVLDRPGAQPVQFTAQRQMFIYIGIPRSTCSMVGVVTYGLGGDIAEWLQKPVDGAKLGKW